MKAPEEQVTDDLDIEASGSQRHVWITVPSDPLDTLKSFEPSPRDPLNHSNDWVTLTSPVSESSTKSPATTHWVTVDERSDKTSTTTPISSTPNEWVTVITERSKSKPEEKAKKPKKPKNKVKETLPKGLQPPGWERIPDVVRSKVESIVTVAPVPETSTAYIIQPSEPHTKPHLKVLNFSYKSKLAGDVEQPATLFKKAENKKVTVVNPTKSVERVLEIPFEAIEELNNKDFYSEKVIQKSTTLKPKSSKKAKPLIRGTTKPVLLEDGAKPRSNDIKSLKPFPRESIKSLRPLRNRVPAPPQPHHPKPTHYKPHQKTIKPQQKPKKHNRSKSSYQKQQERKKLKQQAKNNKRTIVPLKQRPTKQRPANLEIARVKQNKEDQSFYLNIQGKSYVIY